LINNLSYVRIIPREVVYAKNFFVNKTRILGRIS